MALRTRVVLLAALALSALAQQTPLPWAAEMTAAKNAFTEGKYPLAAQKYADALAIAEIGGASAADILPILRPFAVALRSNNDPAGANQILDRAIAAVKSTSSNSDAEVAALLSELAVVQRAQGLRQEGVQSLQQAMFLRRRSPMTEQVARDTTLLATLFHEMGEEEKAGMYFEGAVSIWGMFPDSGLQILTALDPLASLRRNQRRYEKAEELYTWELRLQEAALGPKDAELIATLDSLAYVLFGQKKYVEAEPVYNRLLSMWEMVGGNEHPMVALTLDKMAEFYLDQKRYDVAEPIVRRALVIRAKAEIETLHRTGRVLLGQRKMDEALTVYSRAVRIAAEVQISDEHIPGTLRAYALLLRNAQRNAEASAIDKRLEEAIREKERREGKRNLPAPETPKVQQI